MVAALNSVFIFVRVLELCLELCLEICLELCRGGRSLPRTSATFGAPSNTLIFFFPCFSFSRTSWRRSSRSSRTACCSASILSSMDGPGAGAASTVDCSGSDSAGGGAAVRDADINSHGFVFATGCVFASRACVRELRQMRFCRYPEGPLRPGSPVSNGLDTSPGRGGAVWLEENGGSRDAAGQGGKAKPKGGCGAQGSLHLAQMHIAVQPASPSELELELAGQACRAASLR